MSYRNTFITDYIYQASDDVRDANADVKKVFEDWIGSGLKSKVDDRGYGFYAGVFRGLYPTEYKDDLVQIIPKLEKATKVPFRLTILPECASEFTIKIIPN